MTRNIVAEIRRATRRKFSAREKIRVVLEGRPGEISVCELCTREVIYPSIYHRWSEAFLEAGKNALALDGILDALPPPYRTCAHVLPDMLRANLDLEGSQIERFLRVRLQSPRAFVTWSTRGGVLRRRAYILGTG